MTLASGIKRIVSQDGSPLRATCRTDIMRTVGMLVIYKSPDGINDWAPVLPEDVPMWVKDPDVLQVMVEDGQAAQKGESEWYRAEKVKQ